MDNIIPTKMSDSLVPVATYKSPGTPEGHAFHPGDGPHTTNGKTTQISDIVIKAGGQDRDKPSNAEDTPLGQLRAKLTTLQDQINTFLTERMNNEKNRSNEENELERKLLDEGVDEESD